ncbi:phosphoribosylaminoimidazole-succinocarboxamide synthase-like protein [Hyaloscypha bicolor E]|uniref:Phosphoribosylaminoimidazole-succinocarboxamide synthase n=1 Tax=Hyaloscypha bicolor E TaxID=1095630 RepID=A0A2J6SU79_9HELO|nr:phosphoribosylaminoimidazole-succinocarboxamide synthase-like protein [Hyaloscypha bicolor E]PMD54335.1 phosphoribosylaminoimidazole-succinocarboxamide synthase-like protein [Hyaloscypha bicolor E]
MAEPDTVVTKTSLEALPKIAEGKVRDLYEVDSKTLLFVASDRISAYDVIMDNGVPSKGKLLTLLSAHWFKLLPTLIPDLRTHFLTLSLPSSIRESEHAKLQNRSMQVRRLKIFPIEAIVRGYITGSAWKEYQRSGTVHKMPIVAGLKESEAFPQGAIYTPSTKAEAGQNDENISIAEAAKIVGPKYAQKIEDLAIKLYTSARDYAAERGIIIADSKFEFGLDEESDEVVLVDEVLTPDSSRFWPADKYQIGREQMSYDKQYLRDWLTSEGLKGKQGVKMPEEVVNKTAEKYREAFEKLTGQKWVDAVKI